MKLLSSICLVSLMGIKCLAQGTFQSPSGQPTFTGVGTGSSSGGTTNGIQQLNGFGTNTTLVNATIGGFVRTNEPLAVTLSNTNNNITANKLTLDTSDHTQRGRFVFDPIFGIWDSPDDSNFNLFINVAHGGTGNGTEMQLQVNQMYLGPVSGGHFQFGLANDVPDTFYVNRALGSTSLHGQSHLIGWHYAWQQVGNTNNLLFGKWDSQVTNYDNVTGDSTLEFYYNLNDVGEDGQFANSVKGPLSLDSKGYVKINNSLKSAVTNVTTVTTNCVINFNAMNNQVVNIAANTTFSVTNIVLTNQEQFVDMWLYPGPSTWALTFPTNILAESESGITIMPTNLPGSTIMHLKFDAVYGTTTNIFCNVKLAPYSPLFDTNASNFFVAASITDATQKAAVNQFVINAKAHGYWTNLDIFYPYVGGTSNTHSWNLINTATNRIAWTGGVTHDTNGITGNGTTGFGDTAFNPATATSPHYTQNSATFGIYSKTTTPANTPSYMGSVVSPIKARLQYNGSSLFGVINEGGGQGIVPASGIMLVTRTAPTVTVTYNSGGNTGGSGASTGVPNSSFFVLGENNVGLFLPLAGTISCAFAGGGFTAQNESDLAADVLTLETTLSRQ